MAVVFKNNATTTLNGSILAGATSITVTSGAVFPTVTARANPTSPVDNGHYNYTNVLLHGDGTDGTTTILDTKSDSNMTISGGGFTNSTTNPKFGTACISSTTSTAYAYITSAYTAVSTGDFTIEGFFAPDWTGAPREIFGISDGSGTDSVMLYSYGYGSGSNTMIYCKNSGSDGQSTWETPNWSASGSYTFVALERYNSRFTCWINGTRMSNINNLDMSTTNPNSTGYFSIGAFVNRGSWGGFTGKCDEVRFSNIARYQNATSISVPTSAFTYDGYTDPTQSSSTNSTTAGDYFYATITDGVNREVVKVTNVSGNTLTVTRGQDGTSGTAFASGSTIEIRTTNQGLIDLGDDRFYRDVATRSKRYLGA